jgi:hypothetical protein
MGFTRGFLVALVPALSLAGASGAGPPSASLSAPRLLPVPRAIRATCETTARQFGIRVLCPTMLPRASVGWPRGRPPPSVHVMLYGTRHLFAGLSFGYGAPWEPGVSPGYEQNAWRNRPCCFMHFDLVRANARYWGPDGVRPHDARRVHLGGRVGWLRPADGRGALFGNHVRFFFRADRVMWAATLHSFGNGTTPLLARLVKRLRIVAP